MIARFNEHGSSLVLAKRVDGDILQYSIIKTEKSLEKEDKVSRIVGFIEKSDELQVLGSGLMAVGRYVLSADIWPILALRVGGYSAH